MKGPNSIADEYERRYMDAGRALARCRLQMAWWGHALSLMGAVPTVILAWWFHMPWLLVLLPVVVLGWIMGLSLRLAVTPTHVHVQQGLNGPTIPIAAITSAEVASMGSALWSGVWSFVTRIFWVPGFGRGVRIHYRNVVGLPAIAFVSADRPEEIVAAIERARGAVRPLRVDASTVRVGADEDEREDEREGKGASLAER